DDVENPLYASTGRHGDVVRADVVGVAVAAVGTVGHDHVRMDLPQHVKQLRGLFVDRALNEGAGVPVGRDTDHARVPPAADPAQVAVVHDAEGRAGRPQLAVAVAAELVGLGG